MDETRGFLKIMVDRATRRLIGCTVIGPSAPELAYDAAIILRQAGHVDDLAKAVGVFPTLQEGMEGAALKALKELAPDAARGPLAAGPADRR